MSASIEMESVDSGQSRIDKIVDLIYRQLQSIDRLPKRDQEVLARTIDASLSQAS